MREIVEAVATIPDEDFDTDGWCPFCKNELQYPGNPPDAVIHHTPDCPVTKARALLAR